VAGEASPINRATTQRTRRAA